MERRLFLFRVEAPRLANGADQQGTGMWLIPAKDHDEAIKILRPRLHRLRRYPRGGRERRGDGLWGIIRVMLVLGGNCGPKLYRDGAIHICTEGFAAPIYYWADNVGDEDVTEQLFPEWKQKAEPPLLPKPV